MILAVVLILAGIVLIVAGIVTPLPLIACGGIGAVLIIAGVFVTLETAGKR